MKRPPAANKKADSQYTYVPTAPSILPCILGKLERFELGHTPYYPFRLLPLFIILGERVREVEGGVGDQHEIGIYLMRWHLAGYIPEIPPPLLSSLRTKIIGGRDKRAEAVFNDVSAVYIIDRWIRVYYCCAASGGRCCCRCLVDIFSDSVISICQEKFT